MLEAKNLDCEISLIIVYTTLTPILMQSIVLSSWRCVVDICCMSCRTVLNSPSVILVAICPSDQT